MMPSEPPTLLPAANRSSDIEQRRGLVGLIVQVEVDQAHVGDARKRHDLIFEIGHRRVVGCRGRGVVGIAVLQRGSINQRGAVSGRRVDKFAREIGRPVPVAESNSETVSGPKYGSQ